MATWKRDAAHAQPCRTIRAKGQRPSSFCRRPRRSASGRNPALFPTGRSGLLEVRVADLRGDEPMQIVSGPIGQERVHYEAPPRDRLEGEMSRFLTWYNNPPQGLDGLVRTGLAHAWFELIHPFEDGNSRVGRALLDRTLAQDERRAVRRMFSSTRAQRGSSKA